ncbi:MAG: hypothetical protein IAI50_10720 [Candidatus Eremiobacteraeota bacterium]|nr:hypothetical protein [Candidatus Eremiobacteraeota bacterium]
MFVAALAATLVPAIPKQVRIDAATRQTPALSGMRDVAQTMPIVFDPQTLVVVAPDYLGPTVGYYARGERTTPIGFPHRTNPQLSRWDGYGDAWHEPGIVSSELAFLLERFDGRYDRLALLTDPRVVDRGTIPYSIVRLLQRDLERRLPVVERRTFPGRDEAVSVTIFAHPRNVQRRPSRSST